MNGLAGQFCSQCGRPIPAEELERARTEMLELVSDGARFVGQNRLTEAMSIASAALEADPNCGAAVVLYADVLSKQGRTVDAVEAYEHLLRLEPENSEARNRLAELQAKVGTRNAFKLSQPVQFLVTALGMTLILVTVGTAFLLSANPNKKTAVASNTAGKPTSFDVVAPVPAPDIVKAPTESTATNQSQQQGTPMASTTIPSSSVAPAPTANPAKQVEQVVIPAISKQNNLTKTGPAPQNVPIEAAPAPQGNPLPTDVAAVKPAAEAPAVAPAKPAPRNPGVIEIRVRDSQSDKGSKPSEASPNEVKALISVARERYAKGEYEGAAGAYEKALKAGADKATTCQRLGGCYEKLGRKDDAVAAYKRAIDSYQAQNAKNPDPRFDRAIQACRKALEVLEAAE